jgi:hypothetical protein
MEEVDKGHGRLEIRRYWVTENLYTLPRTEVWKGLPSIGRVEQECLEGESRGIEHRYFIHSLAADARLFAQTVAITGTSKTACPGGWR